MRAQVVHGKSLLPAAFAVALLVLQGCNTTGGPGPEPFVEILPIIVALPFVEAVHFPAEIHAWQPFTVEFELSCAQNPDALRTPARPFDGDVPYYSYRIGERRDLTLNVYRDVSQISSSNPTISHVTFELHPLIAGQYKLSYYSALTREEGGRQVTADRLSGRLMGEDETLYRRHVDFTVLP
jgi:hypothetical protein